jgi:3-oxoacyl-[acyl-carrier-protein] synthase III
MAVFTVPNIQLKGVSACVPKNSVRNVDIDFLDVKEKEKLIQTIGIKERRVALHEQSASDLCIAAAEQILQQLNWRADELDILVFITQTPDYVLPGNSSIVAKHLKTASNCILLDMNQGCAGYVYGLSLISNYMSVGKLKKGLLLVGDTITKLIASDNKSILPLFADAGTATAIEYNTLTTPIHFHLTTYAEDFTSIHVEKGGIKYPLQQNEKPELSMKGLEVFNFGLSKVPTSINELLAYSNHTTESITYLVLHQANQLIIDSIAKKLNISTEKVAVSLPYFGNTNGASIPITINTQLKEKTGTFLLCGFGVGLSIGSALLDVKHLSCPDLIEL